MPPAADLPRWITTLCPLLLFLLLALFAVSIPSTSASPVYTIPSWTFGPSPRNGTLMQVINQTVFAASLPTVDYASLPVIRYVGTVSLTGSSSEYGPQFLDTIYPFWTDLINLRGGITIAGQQFLVQMTVSDDQSSPSLMQYLYSQWLADPANLIFMAPLDDVMQKAINPMMVASNRTWFNMLNGDPTDFIPQYPYMLTPANTKDTIPIPPMTIVNSKAQLYHQQVSDATKYDSSTMTSPYGIASLCVYIHEDSFPLVISMGITEWINAENARRQALGVTGMDLVRIVANATWNLSPSAVDVDLYASTLDQCPDEVDMMVIGSETTTAECSAIAEALATTLLRPRAAWTSCTWPSYNTSNAEMVRTWSGWMGHTNPPARPSTTPGATFSNIGQMAQAWALYTGTPAAFLSELFVSNFDVLNAAFINAASSSIDDLRVSWLDLSQHHYYTWVGRNISIDIRTGVNTAAVVLPTQINASGIYSITDYHQLHYPAPWPWSRIIIGGALTSSQSSLGVLVGVFLAVLGCWVAQIVLEQAVFVRRQNGYYHLWLGVVTLTLGGAGLWCSLLMQSSALSTSVEGATQDISFSMSIALLALLPALLLTFVSLMVMMQDVAVKETYSSKGGNQAAYAAREQRRQQQEEKRKKAALSHHEHLRHLGRSVSINVVVGALLFASSIVLTRVTLLYIWIQDANWTPSAAGWVVSIIGHVVLTGPAVLIFYHGIRWRVPAVVMQSAAIVLDWQVNVANLAFTLAAAPQSSPQPLYNVANISDAAVQLVAGIIALVVCIAFVGLQFSRMQLSRNGLAVLVASMENVIVKQRATIAVEQQRCTDMQGQIDQLIRIIECINIVTPINKQYAFALAINACHSSALRNCEFKLLEGVEVMTKSPITSTRPTVVMSTIISGSPTNIIRMSTPIKNLQQLDLHAELAAATSPNKGTSLTPTRFNNTTTPSPAPSRGRWIGQTDLGSANSNMPGSSTSTTVTSETDNESITNRTTLSLAHAVVRSSISLRCIQNNSGIDEEPTNPVMRNGVGSNGAGIVSLGSTNTKGDNEAEYSVSTSAHGSLTAQSAASVLDHAARVKAFEADVLAMLGKLSSSTDFDDDFPARGEGIHAVVQPTLVQLLHHPVCVEVVKAELAQVHSVENAIFYLHVIRYRKIVNDDLRSHLARYIHATFVAEGSEQQINISTRQRDAIAYTLEQKVGSHAPPMLFAEAEREVLILMETNVFKKLTQSPAYRFCQWIIQSVAIRQALSGASGKSAGSVNDRKSSRQPGGEEASTMSATHTSVPR